MPDPLVSIIVPAYHSEKLIGKTLDGIHSQIYRHYEVIIVIDDVNADDTVSVIMKHPVWTSGVVVKLIKREDKTSPANARNRGIQHAVGKYIAFCDADDWWDEDKLIRQVNYFKMHKHVDLVYTLSEWHFPDGHSEFHGVPWGKANLKMVCVAPHSSVMIKKLWLVLVKFNETLKAADDYRWLLDLRKRHVQFASINDPLTHMLIHDGNLTTCKSGFIVQTMKVHAAGGEHHYALLKFGLGSILFVTRYFARKLKLKTKGMFA